MGEKLHVRRGKIFLPLHIRRAGVPVQGLVDEYEDRLSVSPLLVTCEPASVNPC